jgi:hypothetical protein
MKDKLGILVVVICIIVAEGCAGYIWTNIVVDQTKTDMEKELLVNISKINVSSKTGTMMFKIEQKNETFIREFGKAVYIELFNQTDVVAGGDKPTYANTWKVMVANETEHDAELIQELTIGKNYTVWYIDYVNFEKGAHVTNRVNVLVDVDVR